VPCGGPRPLRRHPPPARGRGLPSLQYNGKPGDPQPGDMMLVQAREPLSFKFRAFQEFLHGLKNASEQI
jgi:hypothetical protein